MIPTLREFAFYHPWPPIDNRSLSGWTKTMLLFFDGVAILAPPEVADSVVERDESTMLPLAESGLLQTLDPAEMIDEATADAILEFLFAVSTDPYEDMMSRERLFNYVDEPLEERGIIFRNRLAASSRLPEATRSLAEMLWAELRARGLVSEPLDDGSVRAQKRFWGIYEAFLAYTLRPQGRNRGLDLYPATDDARMVRAFMGLLNVDRHPSAGHVVAFDLEQVAIDLSHTPLDEVLAFRQQYGAQYRSYAANLRRFVNEVSALEADERRQRYQERRSELADAADELARFSRKSWRQPAASISL